MCVGDIVSPEKGNTVCITQHPALTPAITPALTPAITPSLAPAITPSSTSLLVLILPQYLSPTLPQPLLQPQTLRATASQGFRVTGYVLQRYLSSEIAALIMQGHDMKPSHLCCGAGGSASRGCHWLPASVPVP